MRLTATLSSGIESVILVWKTWNLQGFVLLSLFLQFILFFTAPLRKKTTTWIFVALIWSAYQLVDTAISRALSTIYSATKGGSDDIRDLYTLWAVFMLLHFGGPDTITALAMEDNNLWRRSWIRLATQVAATGNVALAATPKNLLSQPYILASSLLILLAGLVKSVERIWSLRKASPTCFRMSLVPRQANPGPDYAAIVEEHNFYKKRGIPVKFVEIKDPAVPLVGTRTAAGLQEELNDADLVKQAYRFYNKFKGMYIDMMFCCHDRIETRDIFVHLSPQAALTVLETEMKFAFEDFYTKAHLFANPMWEKVRFLSFFLESAALVLWLCSMHLYQSVEVLVTTSLLSGAVFIDVIAFVRIYLSDWKIARSAAKASSQIPLLFGPLLYIRRRRWGEYPQETPLFNKFLRILFRQWSESISQFNFLNYCILERPKWRNKLYTCLGAKDMMDGRKYVFDRWLTNNLREFIFQELKHKSSVAEELDTWEEVNSSRGSWTLRYNASNDLDPASFEPWIKDVEYDESLLMWHIATEQCYETEDTPDDREEQKHRILSKILSDYTLYLSVRQSKLISAVAPMTEVIFNDTCKEARQLFHNVMASSLPNANKEEVHKEACQRIKQVMTNIPPSYIKEEENNSVLFDACELAKRLMRVESSRWKLISQIWVELLCYAAAHSPGSAHAMLLSQGGELVTLVRLLMLHLGLSNQFRKAKCIPRAELIVGM